MRFYLVLKVQSLVLRVNYPGPLPLSRQVEQGEHQSAKELRGVILRLLAPYTYYPNKPEK